jgi:dephospho-CoA kinase
MPEDGPDGKGRPINRPVLGRRVFGDGEEETKNRKVLNGIVHPAVRWEMFKAVMKAYFQGYQAVVLDVPLLFESRLDRFCGSVVVVAVSDPETQLARLRARDPHLTEEDARRRVISQGDVREKATRAETRGKGRGAVVWNDGDREDLKREVDKVVKELLGEGVTRGYSPRWWAWLLWGCPPLAAAVAAWEYNKNQKANKDWERERAKL